MSCSAGLQHQLQLNQTSSSILSVFKASLPRQLEDLSQDKGEGHPRSRRSHAGSSDMQLYVCQLFVTPSDGHIFSNFSDHIQKIYRGISRSLQIWRQLQVFALFRRAVRNMASVENEVPFKPKMTETCVSSKKKRHLSWCHVLQACSTSFNWIKRVRASAACWQQVWQRPFRIRPAATRTRFTPMIWWSTNSLLYIRQWHIINTSFWQLADVEEAFERNVLRKITLYRHDSQYRPPFHPVRFIADAFGRGKRS